MIAVSEKLPCTQAHGRLASMRDGWADETRREIGRWNVSKASL